MRNITTEFKVGRTYKSKFSCLRIFRYYLEAILPCQTEGLFIKCNADTGERGRNPIRLSISEGECLMLYEDVPEFIVGNEYEFSNNKEFYLPVKGILVADLSQPMFDKCTDTRFVVETKAVMPVKFIYIREIRANKVTVNDIEYTNISDLDVTSITRYLNGAAKFED